MTNNIILFLTDQWRWDTLNDPESPTKLPNLQRFAEEATNYVNAFTTVPLCTPARGSLFTGKWPHQNGTMDNVQGRSYYPQGRLHKDQTTYLERLRDAGYEVTFIGKWHLGDGDLIKRGIKDVRMSDGGDEPFGSNLPDLTFEGPQKTPYYGTISLGTPADGIRVQEAIKVLKEKQNSTTPFCLVVSLQAPHFPHWVPKEFVALYDDLPDDYLPDNYCPQFSETGKPVAQSRAYWPCQDTSDLTPLDWRRTAQHYFGFCSYVDDLFGQFNQAVTMCGFEDAVLAFASDHGEMLGAHGWFDKGPYFYEEVMRIPMLIRKGSEAGTAEKFVSFRDLFPTIFDAAGISDILDEKERARSYRRSNADHITYCYDAYQGRQFRLRGIRNARYKYAWSPNDLPELYDLDSDPLEQMNRAGDSLLADVEADLKKRLFNWMDNEQDYLRFPTHQLPIGSYADGRDRAENAENKVPPGKPY